MRDRRKNYAYDRSAKATKGLTISLIILSVVLIAAVVVLLVSGKSNGKTDLQGVPTKMVDLNSPGPDVTVQVTQPLLTQPASVTVKPSETPTPTVEEHKYSEMVVFSENKAVYTSDISVELSFDSLSKGKIYYTTDGTEPTAESTPYTGAIKLAAATGEEPKVYQINAVAVKEDGSLCESSGHTYFVGAQADSRYTTLVISIYGDEKELTAGPDGILYGTNVNNKGREYERKVYIQAFEDGEVVFEQFGGVRAYGGKSRSLAIPSLKIYARKSYSSENGSFSISAFETPRLDKPEKYVKKYDKLVLRNGGDDFQSGMIRDELAQMLAKEAGFTDYEAVVPVVVYLNGEYYGLMWLHESYCDDYFQNKYGKANGEFVVVEGAEKSKSTAAADDDLEKAAATEYNTLYKKYAYADLTKDAVYKELCSVIDVENYLKYYAYQLYIANFDWPMRNYKCYRYYAAEGEAYGEGVYDGRWRFLFHDMDNGLGMFTKGTNIKYEYNDYRDVLTANLEGVSSEAKQRYSPLFAALMKRADCKKFFVEYTYELMDGALSYDNVKKVLDGMNEARYTELMNHYYPYLAELRKAGNSSIWTSSKYYTVYYEQILEFAKNRPEYVKKYIKETLSYSN